MWLLVAGLAQTVWTAVGIRHAIALVHTGWYKTISSAAGQLQHLHAAGRSFGHVIKLATDSVGGYFEAAAATSTHVVHQTGLWAIGYGRFVSLNPDGSWEDKMASQVAREPLGCGGAASCTERTTGSTGISLRGEVRRWQARQAHRCRQFTPTYATQVA